MSLAFSNRASVSAQVDGVTGEAQVILVVGPLFRVSLFPESVTTVPGATINVRAAALDSFGNGVPSTVIEWSVTGSGTVTPEALGTGQDGSVPANVTVNTPGTVRRSGRRRRQDGRRDRDRDHGGPQLGQC